MSSRLLRHVGALAASTSRASSSPTAAFARTFVAGSVENHAIGARTAPNVARRAFARSLRHDFASPSTGGPRHGPRVEPFARTRLDRRALCASPAAAAAAKAPGVGDPTSGDVGKPNEKVHVSPGAAAGAKTAMAVSESEFDLRMLKSLVPYIWPKDKPDHRRRVVGALSLLIASKLLNVGTPFLFKHAVDALAVSTAGAATGRPTYRRTRS